MSLRYAAENVQWEFGFINYGIAWYCSHIFRDLYTNVM